MMKMYCFVARGAISSYDNNSKLGVTFYVDGFARTFLGRPARDRVVAGQGCFASSYGLP